MAAERYAISIITQSDDMFREMRRVLAPSSHTSLASTEGQIKSVIEDLEIQAIVLDLDASGTGRTMASKSWWKSDDCATT